MPGRIFVDDARADDITAFVQDTEEDLEIPQSTFLSTFKKYAGYVLYTEGMPPMKMEKLLAAGFDVRYCPTRSLREHFDLSKSHIPDTETPRLLATLPESVWITYESLPEEVHKARAAHNDGHAAKVFLVALKQRKDAETVSYNRNKLLTSMFDNAVSFEEFEKRMDTYFEPVCKEIGLHEFHTDDPELYGVGCGIMVWMAKEYPPRFYGKLGGWLSGHGYGNKNWERKGVGRKGDYSIKGKLFARMRVFKNKESPHRPFYDEQYEKYKALGVPQFHQKGKSKAENITINDKAECRLATKIMVSLYKIGMKWAKSRLGITNRNTNSSLSDTSTQTMTQQDEDEELRKKIRSGEED